MILKKIKDPEEALCCIPDGSVVAVSGFNLLATPEYLLYELYKQYRKTGHPRDLFMIFETLPAVPGRAFDKIAEIIYRDKDYGFIRGVLAPYLGFSPWLQKLVAENLIEAYTWPIGITVYWFREVASGRPGLLTRIGLGTFLDPRDSMGAINDLALERKTCKISLTNIDGEEYLFYQAPKPNIALIRGSVADEMGNISLSDEAIRGTVLNIAQATKALPKKGIVIAQVKWITKLGLINPREVDVPAPLVDYVVVAPREYHWQSGSYEYDPRLSYRVIPPIDLRELGSSEIERYSEHEHIIARRTLIELVNTVIELNKPILVNLGIGIPALVSWLAAYEEISDYITTVVESGVWGGVALGGQDFGAAISPFALTSMPDMFSNFEGGIIDTAVLGFLEVDKEGNVNPSVLPGRLYGPGGFPVIAGGSPKTVFAGSFTAGERKIYYDSVSKRLVIEKDGSILKFVERVYKTFFSGRYAIKFGHDITYITERAVFKLTPSGVELVEIAPGVDLERDILSKMKFRPLIARDLREMEPRVFVRGRMGLKEQLVQAFKK
ncbi:MAG: malonate decarboxylase subunit alpha [Sulfolobales archaeon]